jgi:hypothetical protein
VREESARAPAHAHVDIVVERESEEDCSAIRRVVVTHRKREQSWSADEADKFEFTWEYRLIFSSVSSAADASAALSAAVVAQSSDAASPAVAASDSAEPAASAAVAVAPSSLFKLSLSDATLQIVDVVCGPQTSADRRVAVFDAMRKFLSPGVTICL